MSVCLLFYLCPLKTSCIWCSNIDWSHCSYNVVNSCLACITSRLPKVLNIESFRVIVDWMWHGFRTSPVLYLTLMKVQSGPKSTHTALIFCHLEHIFSVVWYYILALILKNIFCVACENGSLLILMKKNSMNA